VVGRIFSLEKIRLLPFLLLRFSKYQEIKGVILAYIRVKKLRKKSGKEYRYAYVVENKWRKRGSHGSKKGARQKVKAYLGKVYDFKRVFDKEFVAHFSVGDVKEHVDLYGIDGVARNLVRLELLNHGFEEVGDFYSNGSLAVYINDKEFLIKHLKEEKDKKIVLAMNEGFLCKETFSNLIKFKGNGNEQEVGLQLANAFVEAGLKVPKEVFVEVFGKVVE